MFNPNLIGYASSDSYVFEPKAWFNIAQSGAMSRDMPFMAERLVERIKNDPRVNLNKHWKVFHEKFYNFDKNVIFKIIFSFPIFTIGNIKSFKIQNFRKIRLITLFNNGSRLF